MPLLFDMPMEQLKEYQGTTPCPADFDSFWDKSLDEMKALDPQLELIPSTFKSPVADCFDLYFTGLAGARVHAKYLKPKNAPEPHPAVVQFHGYSGNCGEWWDKLAYVGMGFSVISMDCRGQWGLSEGVGTSRKHNYQGHIVRGLDEGPENLFFRYIFLDTAQLAGIVMNLPEVDPNAVGAMGGSQGGGLTLACASLEPRIKQLAPIYPFLSDYRRVWDIDLAKNAYIELQIFFRYYDPQHLREDDLFTQLGYIDIQNLTRRIKGEVLMGVGLQDQICPPSTQFAAFNKIQSKKNLAIFPDFGHEGLPGFPDKVYQFMAKLKNN